LALASPELDVKAITTVAGNVPLDLTTINALKMVELANRQDVPVYAGCSRPMLRPLYTAEYVHGPTGIDGAVLDEPAISVADGHAVDQLIDFFMSSAPGELTLCTLGPLTNVAMALIKEPAIATRITEIVAMCGAFFEGGNTTPAAEFNIYVDPHAARVVFESGVPITLMPLDVTHKALSTPERVEAFRDLDTKVGRVVAGMLDFYDRHDIEKYGFAGGPLHDPCVVVYLLAPDLFAGKHCNVQVATDDGPSIGATLIDWWEVLAAEKNATVMREIDADGFFELLVQRIGTL